LKAAREKQQTTYKVIPLRLTADIGTQPYPLADRLPKVTPSTQTSQNTPVDKALPFRENDPAPPTRTQALVLPTGNHHKADDFYPVLSYPLEHIPPTREP